MNKLKAIAFHTLEFLIVLGMAIVVIREFHIDSPTEGLLIATVLTAFAKTVRELKMPVVPENIILLKADKFMAPCSCPLLAQALSSVLWHYLKF